MAGCAWQDRHVKQPPLRFDTTRRRCTHHEKAEILLEYQRSGLSLLAFAREHQLCYTTLLGWKKQFHREGGSVAVEKPPGFVAVQVESESRVGDFTLNLPRGRSLQIPPGFEPESLRRLLDVLEALP